MGLLLYSSHGGWSAVDKESGDPRPASMDPAVGSSLSVLAWICL